MYDRTMLTVLPAANVTLATGVPAAFTLTQAAGTEGNSPYTAGAAGIVDSILLQIATATVWPTTALVLAVHVNDVEVGVVTIPTGLAQGVNRRFRLLDVAGASRAFKAGDVLKVEIKTQPAGAGLAGSAIPYLGIRSE